VRILHVVGGLDVGGVQRSVALLALGLHAAGHQVTVVNLAGPDVNAEPLEAAGVRVVHLRMGTARSPGGLLRLARGLARLWRIVLQGRWDVVQTHLFKTAVVTAPVARLTRARVVGTVHGIDPSAMQRRLAGLPARCAHAVVAVSTPLADDVARDTTIPRRLLTVVPDGVDDPGRRLDRATARREAGLPDGVLVGCIGRLWERKGQRELFAGWPAVIDGCPDARLVVVGDGPLRGELDAAAAGRAVRGSVLVTGTLDDVPTVLDGLDVVVVPSHHEGFSLVTVEAMLHGLPVVATAAGGPRELVDDGVTGLLVPARDVPALAAALTRLCADPALRDRLGAAGLAKARDRYTVEAMTRGYLDLYDRLRPPARS
jgi:glycosyltransferase involved in cell wall biosynthesis